MTHPTFLEEVARPVIMASAAGVAPPPSTDGVALALTTDHAEADATVPAVLKTPSPAIKPPYTPRPRPQQKWVHSCCSQARLERALGDPGISAIEADIMMGVTNAGSTAADSSLRPVMAHPTWRGLLPDVIDLGFVEFLERCLADGTRHLKLDFKDFDAVEPCLQLLAERWPQLHANGQAVWLNADVLPGPNARQSVKVPASKFVPLCRRLCPHAVLSLGWCVGPIGPEESYSENDVLEMRRLCAEFDLPGASVIFASSLRLAERAMPLMSDLLCHVADSQLLFWTGTGELPVHPSTHNRIQMQIAAAGFAERVGYDVQVARTCCQLSSANAIDCTFFWSRWSRYLLCPTTLTQGMGSVPLKGERQPLVRDSSSINGSSGGVCTPNNTPLAPSRATIERDKPMPRVLESEGAAP